MVVVKECGPVGFKQVMPSGYASDLIMGIIQAYVLIILQLVHLIWWTGSSAQTCYSSECGVVPSHPINPACLVTQASVCCKALDGKL